MLLLTRRYRPLLGWIGFTCFVHMFDTIVGMNMFATRLVGLIFLPVAIGSVRWWIRIPAAKAWVIGFLYLVLLGVLFGYVWPWPDITGTRPITLRAQGRTIIFLLRTLADFSLIVFVAREARKPGNIIYIVRALVVGATTSAVAGIFHYITRIDLYLILTGLLRDFTVERPRGLSFEPRGLGLACAYAIVILLVAQRRLFRGWIVLIMVNAIALMLTYSASAIGSFLVMLMVSFFFFTWRVRLSIVGAGLAGLLAIAAAMRFMPAAVEFGQTHLASRVSSSSRVQGVVAKNIGEEIAFRLDVFDGAAMLFFLAEPRYAVIGTGPGLISLPSSYHVPPGIYSAIWTPQKGLNSIPSHGLLLELANGGVLLVIVWFVQVFSCWKALRILSQGRKLPRQFDDWTVGTSVFLIGAAGYVVQNNVVPLFSVILGIGWAASLIVHDARWERAAQRAALRRERLGASLAAT